LLILQNMIFSITSLTTILLEANLMISQILWDLISVHPHSVIGPPGKRGRHVKVLLFRAFQQLWNGHGS